MWIIAILARTCPRIPEKIWKLIDRFYIGSHIDLSNVPAFRYLVILESINLNIDCSNDSAKSRFEGNSLVLGLDAIPVVKSS